MEIQKGSQYTVKKRFTSQGAPAVFDVPPKWTLYNSYDVELLSGAATLSSGYWTAVFTVPTNYIVNDGKEKLVLQFVGSDNKKRTYTSDQEIELIDSSENFIPNGVFFNYITDENISDSIVLPVDEATFEIKMYDPWGNQLGTTQTITQPYDIANSNGYVFNLTIPKLVITRNTFLDPCNIVYKITTVNGTETETRPLFILDFRTINTVNALQGLLDKSKLVEVDPSLQWHDVELMQAVLEGVKRVNSSPPEGTFWKLHDFPTMLDTYLLYAAAVHALNARFLAEGLNAFDFTGLNTQLNFNRTEYLSQLIDRLNAYLDTLPQAKKSAISSTGKGEPTEGERDLRVKNQGILGLTINRMNNRIGYNRARRFF